MKCGGATTDLDYPDYAEQLRPDHPELAAAFVAFTGLESVLNWLNGRGPTAGAVDIVGMDEFHYDFLVRLDGGRWAAFGVTGVGELTAVAVWPDKPTADALLALRLERGWKPTWTSLQEGAKILGHAACLVEGGQPASSLGSTSAR